MIPPFPLPTVQPRLYLPRLPWLWAFMALGLALRLWHINAAFWYDEVFSASLAKLPLDRLWLATWGDVHPPAYYLLLWGFTKVWGYSEIALRLPSVIAGLALIWVVDRLANSLGMTRPARLLATGLTALAPFQVYYSQEARAYSLLMLACAVAALALVERRPGLLIGASLAALYLHHMAAPFIGSLLLLAITTRRFDWSKLAIITGLIILGYGPGAWLTIHQMGNITGDYWVPPLDNPGRVIATMDDFIFFSPDNSFVIASGLITGLTLALILSDFQHIFNDPKPFIKIMVIVPMALVSLASLIWQPIFISRVVAPASPFYYLWLAEGATLSQRRLTSWLILAAPVMLAILLIGPFLGEGRKEGKELYNLASLKPGQGMYHANVGSMLIWAWYRPDLDHWLWPHNGGLSESLSQQTKEALSLRQAPFDAIACTHRLWWFIYFHNPTTTPQEIAYTNQIERDYPSERVVRLRSDEVTEAWIVRVSPDCSVQAAH